MQHKMLPLSYMHSFYIRVLNSRKTKARKTRHSKMDAMFAIHAVIDKSPSAVCPSCATYLEELELLHFTNKI